MRNQSRNLLENGSFTSKFGCFVAVNTILAAQDPNTYSYGDAEFDSDFGADYDFGSDFDFRADSEFRSDSDSAADSDSGAESGIDSRNCFRTLPSGIDSRKRWN